MMTTKAAAPSKLQSYRIGESPLFHIRSKRRLAAVLGWQGPPSGIATYAKRSDNFRRYIDRRKPDKPRLVEAPQLRIKKLQKRIEGLLKRIKLPPYLHSGTPGRSYLSNSIAHRDAEGCTITMDITEFFQSVTQDQVERLFLVEFDCSRDIAATLAGLVCCDGHLATGSPASPLLSFFAHQSLFQRIADRAARVGAVFTLYMDDIAITGVCVGHGDAKWIETLLRRAALRIKRKKTKVFRASRPKLITGRVLMNGKSRAPNSQHQKMKMALEESKAAPDDGKLRASAVGRMRHVALLDEDRRLDLRKVAKEMA